MVLKLQYYVTGGDRDVKILRAVQDSKTAGLGLQHRHRLAVFHFHWCVCECV